MKDGLAKNLVLAGFSLVCLACVAGITLVLYDVVSNYTHSDVSGYGAAAVFVMIVGFAVRWLWGNRQIER